MRARLLGTALVPLALLADPVAALAVTDRDFRDLGRTDTTTTPHVAGGGVGSAGRVLLGLLLVVGVILAVYWVLKRAQGGRTPGARGGADGVEVLSTTALAPNRRLHLVRVGGEVLLLGATDHGIATLHRLAHDEAVEQGLVPADEGNDPHAAVDPGLLRALGAPSARRAGAAGLLDALRERTSR